VPRTRTTFRGATVDVQVAAMLAETERLLGRRRLVITQGSWSATVEASAGTHAGAGAVDISTRDTTHAEDLEVVRALRTVGFAAWVRTPGDGPWPEHIHAVAVDVDGLAPAAARQVAAARAGRDGLARNGPDPHAGLRLPVTTWQDYQRTKKDDMAPLDWTKADWQAFEAHVFDAVWKRDALRNLDVDGRQSQTNPTWQAASFLEWGQARQARLFTRVAALEAVLTRLAERSGITAEQIRAIIAEEVVRVQVSIDVPGEGGPAPAPPVSSGRVPGEGGPPPAPAPPVVSGGLPADPAPPAPPRRRDDDVAP